MNVTVAIDSFKGSLESATAGKAIKEGIIMVYPEAAVNICPIADGGEGTVEAIVSKAGGQFKEITVHNPLGKSIKSSYAILSDGKTAVIEISSAAGITLIKDDERNPLVTTTYGVGEMIKDAIESGCREFIIGIGGSATNDGGIGMLSALGFEFFDEDKNKLCYGAEALKNLTEIRFDNVLSKLKECKFFVACDVKNILCGENGCSAVYGPQKGATPEMIESMDFWLYNFAQLTKKYLPSANENAEGAGAAGGLGFALLSYLNAELKSGIDLIIEKSGLEKYIIDSDFVITGEGRLDGQSYMGKAPVGVSHLAKKYNKPVIAFAGGVTEEAVVLNEYGIDSFFPIVRMPCTLEDAVNPENAYKNLKNTVCQVFRLIKCVLNSEI